MHARRLFAALVLVAACESSTDNDDASGVVTISPPSPSIAVGATVQLTATVTEFTGSDAAVQWLTLDGDVASVSATGLVTARSPGVADIVARVRSSPLVRATARVTVTGN